MNVSLSAKWFTYFYRQNNGCGIADPHVWLSCSADKDFDSKISTTKVRVFSDGTCYWIPPGLFQSSCAMDVSWFPFDEQICFLKFGSWIYDGFQLNLRLQDEYIDLSDYFASNEWSLIGRSTVLTRLRRCCYRHHWSTYWSVCHTDGQLDEEFGHMENLSLKNKMIINKANQRILVFRRQQPTKFDMSDPLDGMSVLLSFSA